MLATEVFPDCDVGYLREKLVKYEHSILEQTAEELVAERRWPERLPVGYGQLEASDMFRSESYKAQAAAQLAIDYPQVRSFLAVERERKS